MKKEKKILTEFAAIVLLAVGGGFGAGVMGSENNVDLKTMAYGLMEKIVRLSPYLMFLSVVFIVLAFSFYIKGKKLVAVALTGDNKEECDTAYRYLEKGVQITGYHTIFTCAVFGAMVSGFYDMFGSGDIPLVLTALAFFMVGMFVNLAIQTLITKQIKLLNPEKQGNGLDVSLKQELSLGCDEREKATNGAAAHKACQMGVKAVLVSWIVTVVASFVFPIGPLPAILLAVVWAVIYSAYLMNIEK